MLQAGFIFLASVSEPQRSRAVVPTDNVALTVIGVNNYSEAVAAAKELAENGCTAIELCGGFGHEGTAAVAEAVKGKACVGVVRFDIHPGLGNVSGDGIF